MFHQSFIVIGDESFPVTVFEVGMRFAHGASVTVRGKEYRSADVPFGFRTVAIEDLLEKVQKDHAKARWV